MKRAETVAHGRRWTYAIWTALTLIILAIAVLVGTVLVDRHRPGTTPALWMGCAASFAASLAGTLPILAVWGKPPLDAHPGILGSIAARLTVALVLGAGLALFTELDPVTLLISLAASHAALLGADVWLTRRAVVAGTRTEPETP